MNGMKTISVVAPVYNEEEVLETFYSRVKSVLEGLDYDYEILFVDDGSRDRSYAQLVELADSDPHVRVVKFSRNFGHQMAITAGIDHACGDAVVIIDTDLQDPPETIADFVRKWEDGYHVVYGVREQRAGETWLKLTTARLYYRLLSALAKTEIPRNVGDFRLMDRQAVNQLRELREHDRYVRGLVSWIGFRQTGVYYKRDPRYAGTTKYPWRKMIRFALDGITSFSSAPLNIAGWMGYGTSLLGFLYLCSVLVQKALGYTVQGWATLMVAILFLGGVQLICLGVIGQYIGRIFTETKRRPLYIVETIYEPAADLAGRADYSTRYTAESAPAGDGRSDGRRFDSIVTRSR